MSSAPRALTRTARHHALWHWATPQAQRVLPAGDLGKILRFHRDIHGINQVSLGQPLGYDKTYISMLELGKRTLDDISSRRKVTDQLRLPSHVLGITDPADPSSGPYERVPTHTAQASHEGGSGLCCYIAMPAAGYHSSGSSKIPVVTDGAHVRSIRFRRSGSPARPYICRLSSLILLTSKAVRERPIEVNVAALVELPSGKAPKALVWTDERITAWKRDFAAHIEKMNARRRRESQLEPHKRIGERTNRLDAYIGAPRPSKVMVWTPALTQQFLRRARVHRLYAQYHLIAFRGPRRGESCGLRGSDVDLENGTATIRWQITQTGSATFEGKPKTDAGEATISLDTETIKVLRAHKARQNIERLGAGATPGPKPGMCSPRHWASRSAPTR
jgi:hypothetical protein